MKPNFPTLIALTCITALLLMPFVLSDSYLTAMRANSVDLHSFLRGEAYKQVTGYLALFFVLVEMLLTLRKRGRSWFGKLALPGSVQLWRVLHIFTGVGLVAVAAIHTLGANGLNFNAVFLWVFFGVTLSALIGVVAETGILESPRKQFGLTPPPIGNSKFALVVSKGPLIRGLRAVWLTTHIFLVSVFLVMLGIHIFLAYYFV